MMAVVAVPLSFVVWRRIERNRIAAWVNAVDRQGVAAFVEADVWDPSPLGQVRGWLRLPVVQVYVWDEQDGSGLLQAPRDGPRPLLIYVHFGIRKATLDQLAKRFPHAELRPI